MVKKNNLFSLNINLNFVSKYLINCNFSLFQVLIYNKNNKTMEANPSIAIKQNRGVKTLTKQQSQVIKNYLMENYKNPNPSKEEFDNLVNITGATRKQVSHALGNHKRRFLRKYLESQLGLDSDKVLSKKGPKTNKSDPPHSETIQRQVPDAMSNPNSVLPKYVETELGVDTDEVVKSENPKTEKFSPLQTSSCSIKYISNESLNNCERNTLGGKVEMEDRNISLFENTLKKKSDSPNTETTQRQVSQSLNNRKRLLPKYFETELGVDPEEVLQIKKTQKMKFNPQQTSTSHIKDITNESLNNCERNTLGTKIEIKDRNIPLFEDTLKIEVSDVKLKLILEKLLLPTSQEETMFDYIKNILGEDPLKYMDKKKTNKKSKRNCSKKNETDENSPFQVWKKRREYRKDLLVYCNDVISKVNELLYQ